MITFENEQDFLSDPQITQNQSLLEEIGVFNYIEQLNREIKNYKSLLFGAANIFQRNSVEEILDAAVWQISDHFMPSFIGFLWRPYQNKEAVTARYYENYKLAAKNIGILSISPFEPFFKKYPKPIAYDMFAFQLKDMNSEADLAPLDKLRPELLIPVIGPSGLYGIVLVGHKKRQVEYGTRELIFLEQLMSFVSQAIQNHLHYEHSVRDVKTGLFNHGFLITRLNEEIARTKRSETSSSLLVMDVDKFKNFNDQYGHLAGDRVLECLAATLKQAVRADDVPSRFGGEEFTVLLPNTPSNTAYLVAERLRVSIEAMQVPWDPPLPPVTISLGLVSFGKNTSGGADEIIHRADEALYQSKANGRNRTTVWDDKDISAQD